MSLKCLLYFYNSKYLLLLMLMICSNNVAQSEPGTTQNCVDAAQRRITGGCPKSDVSLFTQTQELSLDLKVDAQPNITNPITFTVTVGGCAIKPTAFRGPKANLIMIDDTTIAPSFQLKTTDKSLDVMSSADSTLKLVSITCVPQFVQSGTRFKIQVILQMDTVDKTINLQFTTQADFSLPTTTSAPSSKGGGGSGDTFPTWAIIVLCLIGLLIILCIIFGIAVCIWFLCRRKRRQQQKPTKVDVAVQPSECASNLGRESIHVSRMSVISDFDSYPPSEWQIRSERGVTDL